MSIFTGSGVAIITPFNEDGSVNFEVLKELIEFQISNGTDAIVIAGTTGESAAMSDDEQIEAIKFTVDTVNKRVPVIAGTGSNVTHHAVELCQRAEEVGVDGLLVVTPYYNKTTQQGLVYHYTEIGNNVNIPIILYSVAGRTGVNIAPATVVELAKIPNIVAIKEASGDLSQIAQIAELCPEIDIYSGNDDQTLPMLALGAKGVISVLANVMPKAAHDICQNFFDGKIAESRQVFLSTLGLANTLFIEVNPVPVKTAVALMGYNVGGTIAPLFPMEEKNLQTLTKALKVHNLI